MFLVLQIQCFTWLTNYLVLLNFDWRIVTSCLIADKIFRKYADRIMENIFFHFIFLLLLFIQILLWTDEELCQWEKESKRTKPWKILCRWLAICWTLTTWWSYTAIQTWCQCESERDRGFADDYMLYVKGKRGLGYATHGVQQLGCWGCNIKFNIFRDPIFPTTKISSRSHYYQGVGYTPTLYNLNWTRT